MTVAPTWGRTCLRYPVFTRDKEERIRKRARIAAAIGLSCLLAAGAILVTAVSMYDAATPAANSGVSKSALDKTVEALLGTDKEGSASDAVAPNVDWTSWKKENADMVGWVRIPGTAVDHPIVQAPESDRDFYLHHDVYKRFNPMGVPYLDADCSEKGLDSPNAIVFGHHWNGGRVFSPLTGYRKKGWATEHDDIVLDTPSGTRHLKFLFSKIVSGANADRKTSFSSREEFEAWYAEYRKGAKVDLAGKEVPDHIYTFVTCSYTKRYEDERILVVAAEREPGKSIWRP